MNHQDKAARARADAQFASIQTQARARSEATAKDLPPEPLDNTARLKAQRLAKEAAERG